MKYQSIANEIFIENEVHPQELRYEIPANIHRV